MLSQNGFLAGFALSLAPMTVHDLRRTLVFQSSPQAERTKMLLEGVLELCKHELITWSLEPDYGNAPPVRPADFGQWSFLKYWCEFIENSDLSVDVPDRKNPTLFLEAKEELSLEISKDCYDTWRKE